MNSDLAGWARPTTPRRGTPGEVGTDGMTRDDAYRAAVRAATTTAPPLTPEQEAQLRPILARPAVTTGRDHRKTA